jgi:hypothetical protein
MAWIMDAISMHRGHSVTGKPVSIGGAPGPGTSHRPRPPAHCEGSGPGPCYSRACCA